MSLYVGVHSPAVTGRNDAATYWDHELAITSVNMFLGLTPFFSPQKIHSPSIRARNPIFIYIGEFLAIRIYAMKNNR